MIPDTNSPTVSKSQSISPLDECVHEASEEKGMYSKVEWINLMTRDRVNRCENQKKREIRTFDAKNLEEKTSLFRRFGVYDK
jgi:hypothetical protein